MSKSNEIRPFLEFNRPTHDNQQTDNLVGPSIFCLKEEFQGQRV